jgi:hypothetical protein
MTVQPGAGGAASAGKAMGNAHSLTAAAKAAAATAKVAAASAANAGLGTKALIGGSMIASFAGRRALWPALGLGGAFTGAMWFGAFEVCFSMAKLVWPIPAKQQQNSAIAGAATVPFTAGGVLWLGSKFTPAMAPPPASVGDLSGMLVFARSLPLKHYSYCIATSAALSAICCRAVQAKGGA